MPNCNICHQPVRIGVVHHAVCWEQAVEALRREFCDDYCRWPREAEDEDRLEEQSV